MTKNMARTKGYKHSEETKRKIRETNKLHAYDRRGDKNPFYGKKHKKETVDKIILAQKGKRTGEENSFYGKKHTEETKKHLIEVWKKPEVRAKRTRKGEKSNFWRGGITKLNKAIRNLSEYKEWRESIFTRDNHTCVFCLERGGELNADHIKPFCIILSENNVKTIEDAAKLEILWDIENGRTLCASCHKSTPTFAKGALKYNE